MDHPFWLSANSTRVKPPLPTGEVHVDPPSIVRSITSPTAQALRPSLEATLVMSSRVLLSWATQPGPTGSPGSGSGPPGGAGTAGSGAGSWTDRGSTLECVSLGQPTRAPHRNMAMAERRTR